MGAGALERPVAVAVVEDHSVVIEGVRSWIANDPERRATIIAITDSIESLATGPGREADVVVLDLELDSATKISEQVAERMVARLTDAGLRVVVFSQHVKPLVIAAVLRAGAGAFLDKWAESGAFVDTIVTVAQDRPVVTPSMAGGMLDGVRLAPREREALLLHFQGMPLASISQRMTKADGTPIKVSTIKDYLERVRLKFAATGRPCRSNYALLARCIEEGLVTAEEIADYRSAAAR
jgi:DNA-binding NarL/FixJ family response regulator